MYFLSFSELLLDVSRCENVLFPGEGALNDVFGVMVFFLVTASAESLPDVSR